MASLNRVEIIGRLGKDPDFRNGICNFSVATDESYTDRDGVRQQRTEWHRVTAFQKLAELCSNYLHKGSMCYVDGRLQTRKWTDQQGQEKFTTEIKANTVIFLDSKQGGGAQQDQPHPRYQQQAGDTTPF